MILFSGSSHPRLATDICAALGVAPGSVRRVRFANECIKIKVDQNVREADVYVLQTGGPPLSDNLIELFILLDAIRAGSARRITVILPYYPYVRSDKRDEPRVSITARLIADLLGTAGADRVLLMDLHSPQVQGFFRLPSDHVTAVPLLADEVRGYVDPAEVTVVAPDAGAAKLAERYARRLGCPLAILEKQRQGDDERAVAVRMVGEVTGRDALIVDDEVSTAGTLVEATEFLHAHGARSVRACIVHGVLCGPALDRLRAARIDQIFVTDSLPPKDDPKVKVLSIAPLLAEAITRIHEGRSVAEMWR